MKPPLKSAAQRPTYYSISKNGGIKEGRKELVLTGQVTNSGTQRHDWDNTHCHGGGVFIYIIQGDMIDFSKLSTAWVFLKREREGKTKRERVRERSRGGVIHGLGAV